MEKNASILAGGDGSRKSRNGETIAAYGWGVYGIGEHSVEYWETRTTQMIKSWPQAVTWIGHLNTHDLIPEQKAL